MKFQSGEIVANRYRILGFHLAGGMQEVYRCFDVTLQREVALKTPKEGIVDKRFNRGAQMGARVNHPNVAATLDYVEENGIRCLVEEFVEGEDLGRRLSAEYFHLDPSLAAWVVHNVAKGIQAAHKVGICHRDLKPSNIMTSGDARMSTIKLTDFGIAKLAENEMQVEMEKFEQDENTLTSSSTLLGAVPYLAPECWSDWSGAGQPMDVWSLGAIACHLLLGKTPFGGGAQAIMKMAQMQQSGSVDLSEPSWFGKHTNTTTLENELWSLIIKCLQLDPTARPSADIIVATCEAMCYSVNERRTGTITAYPLKYASGGKSTSGFIEPIGTHDSVFFHVTDFYGASAPTTGQRVSFSAFAGDPKPRCAPVLLIKPTA